MNYMMNLRSTRNPEWWWTCFSEDKHLDKQEYQFFFQRPYRPDFFLKDLQNSKWEL